MGLLINLKIIESIEKNVRIFYRKSKGLLKILTLPLKLHEENLFLD